MKQICLILFVAFQVVSFAQKKELKLDVAVMQQRSLVTEKMYFFKWIPNTTEYSYLEKFTNLAIGSATKPAKKALTISEFNLSVGAELNWFSNFEWLSSDEFMVNDGNHFYTYNRKLNKGKQWASIAENAANATLSSNHQAIAYTVDNQIEIWKDGAVTKVTHHQDKNIVAGQSIARNEFGIGGGLFWAPTNDQLAFYQKDESDVADYPLLDITTTPGSLRSIKYPMAGQKSEKPSVGIYHLTKKTLVFVYPKSGKDSYLTNLSWTPDGKHILVAEVNRGQNHMWLQLYTSEGQFVKTLFEETNNTWIEPEHPAFFPNASNQFIWISERDGFDNLYLYDLTGKLIKQLTKNTFVAKEIVKASHKGDAVYFAATGPSPLNYLLYKVTLKGKQSLITKNEGTHEMEISSNDAYVLDQFSAHDVPSKTLLLDANGKELKTLMTATSKLNEYQVGKCEIGTLKAKDGMDLYYRTIFPSNFDPRKKYPVMVYVYGGPHAQMITNSYLDGANLWMYWMAEQGYIVYTLDNHGSANRGKDFESVIHRQLGTVEMEDQLLGVDYLKSQVYVDTNRLAVHGWSFGGFMTTSLMLRQPDVFKVGVAGGPVTDWKYYEIMYGERYMDQPEENPEGYAANALTNYTKNLKGDLLLIHGTVDDVVVMQHNFALVKKFVEDGVQMDFFPYPMHPHNVGGKDRVHLMTKVLNYIIEHNQ